MEFDLQSIWTAAGLSAAALVVGVILGFLQSAVPQVTSSGTFRNWALILISGVLVGLAALDSGAAPNIENVLTGVLVFIGLYNASKNAHGGGESLAKKTVNGDDITPAASWLGGGTAE